MDGSKTAVKGGTRRAAVPSVDRLLRDASFAALIEEHGRKPVTEALRDALDALRAALGEAGGAPDLAPPAIAACVAERLVDEARPSLRRVFNLTGTVLHTNLGRAPLPEEAIEAVAEVARGASNLEFDLATGRRGDRDAHVEGWLIRLTGAEAATVVNNNAAAVLLVLNTLARGREVVVSRGELVEIGGAFRIPDVMARAGARMREIGTTNRTHARDYEEAIGPRTALLMKIHTSNYEVRGFTAEVPEEKVAEIAHRKELPMAVDLGSGTLVDLEPFGLPHETTARETVAAGADLVTFSGDKLLGGPQAGMIVGRADLVARCKRNPMKRAMRCDKMTLAALSSVLRLYADPDRLAERVPALRLLARPADEIKAAAQRIAPKLQGRLGDRVTVEIVDCASQIGSGALPVEALPSAGLAIRPTVKRGAGAALDRLAASFRALPVPVIGRVQDGAFVLDLRCLDDEAAFTGQIARLDPVP